METRQVIIQNKDEERQFLEEATEREYYWLSLMKTPKEHIPSEASFFENFPYCITIKRDGEMSWDSIIPTFTLQQFLES